MRRGFAARRRFLGDARHAGEFALQRLHQKFFDPLIGLADRRTIRLHARLDFRPRQNLIGDGAGLNHETCEQASERVAFGERKRGDGNVSLSFICCLGI